MLRRLEDIQALEERDLAPYGMPSRDTLSRRHPEPESRLRSPFQRDRDRIIHSTAFRRLEYKTQVFVNHEGDHYRTRLTHTLEVAQISRSMARVLGLNEDLVESIALSHDLGHPPFGHAGEDALNEVMRAHGGFNHNLQSLRVVDVLEKRYPEFDGLNLTFEIRESMAKHGKVGAEGVAPEFRVEWRPLLEAQLVDQADSLAYNTHDIDDGLRSGFITLEDLGRVRLWRESEEDLLGSRTGVDRKVFTARMVSHLIDLQVNDLLSTTHRRLVEEGIDSVESVRRHEDLLVSFSPEMTEQRLELASFLSEKFYRYYRTVRMAEKAKRFIRRIFDEYRREPGQLSPDHLRRVELDGLDRVICDYLAGMTDRYCQDEYNRLFHPFEPM